MVVLDRVDDRQVPQLGHVEALVDLALVGRAVAEIGEAHAAVARILVLEGEAGAERDLRADDAVAAVEAVLDAEHVHRTALALGNAGGAAGQLGHDHLGVDAIGEHVAVVAIAGDDAVLADRHRRLQPDRDRFLADVEVAEAADQAEAVELPRPLLEAADEQHLLVEARAARPSTPCSAWARPGAPCCGSARRWHAAAAFGFGGTRHGCSLLAALMAARYRIAGRERQSSQSPATKS